MILRTLDPLACFVLLFLVVPFLLLLKRCDFTAFPSLNG